MINILNNGFTGTPGKFLNELKSSSSHFNEMESLKGKYLLANGAFTGVFQKPNDSDNIQVVSMQHGKKSFKEELFKSYPDLNFFPLEDKYFETWLETRLEPILLEDEEFFNFIDSFTADEILNGALLEFDYDDYHCSLMKAITIATKAYKDSDLSYHGDMELDMHANQFARHVQSDTIICIDL